MSETDDSRMTIDEVIAAYPECRQCEGGRGEDAMPYCEPSCPTFTEPHAIARELAERGPFVQQTEVGIACAFCDLKRDQAVLGDYAKLFADPANHEPACLWRRAKVLHP